MRNTKPKFNVTLSDSNGEICYSKPRRNYAYAAMHAHKAAYSKWAVLAGLDTQIARNAYDAIMAWERATAHEIMRNGPFTPDFSANIGNGYTVRIERA